ncbi:hypothetical protein F2P56_037110 [Juglans regia]|uniref:Uncharacterized protein n=1 Tax=Juglans regia TaxID=51240 RepID=A0A833TLJ1_JUGRE|nr:hypothetical protein F2P56_037110 [Juglans regia]KAF5441944.1 hypothetical protein F2P56_037110 [Juglans regia]
MSSECRMNFLQIDRDCLLSLPFDTATPSLNLSSLDCCHREGISCDHSTQFSHIWLPFKGLRGSLPPLLGNLTRLSHLNLSHYSFSGPLPTGVFSSLNQLQFLNLSYNQLNGDISLMFASNGLPSSIQIVDISSNDFNELNPVLAPPTSL